MAQYPGHRFLREHRHLSDSHDDPELDDAHDGTVLSYVNHLRMLGRDESGLPTRGIADVVAQVVRAPEALAWAESVNVV
jgi:hypothetical protein